MKILHFIHSVNPAGGGPVEGIKQMARALGGLGVTLSVASLDAPDDPWTEDFPLPLVTLGPSRFGYGYSPRAVPWLVKHAREYDLIIVNGIWNYNSFAIWLASRRTKITYCIFTHGMLDPWFKRRYPLKHLKKWLYWPWAEYRVLRDAAAVFFTSEEERIQARGSFWLYRCRERVIEYGIEEPPVPNEAQVAYLEKNYPELSGKKLILFMGRIHEKKGCGLLLQAWKEILTTDREAISGYRLVMAGPANNEYGESVKTLAVELGIDSHVSWLGMVRGDAKWGALRSAEAFILPSHQENFGIAVAEALACGLPVLISNKVNIWREVESDGAGMVEPDDLAGTVQMLRRWLKLEESQRSEFRLRARACFEKRFWLQTTARSFAAQLSDIVKAAHRG